MIEIKDFNLSYGNVVLFKDFNFSVQKGQCAGIFAPTGKGKTTLLNKIAEDYIGKYKISYVFQDNKLLEDYSVKKNIMIPLKNIYLSKEECEKKISDILTKVNLEDKINEKVKVLSGGEHQRVNIARAFSYPCDILLMDEAFSAQDEKNKENLILLTKKLCKDYNITSVIVSHCKNDLIKLCDFIIEL